MPTEMRFIIEDYKKEKKDMIVYSSYMNRINKRSLPVKFSLKIAGVPMFICQSKSKSVTFSELVLHDGTFLLSEKVALSNAGEHFLGMLNARTRGNRDLLLKAIDSMQRHVKDLKEKDASQCTIPA